MNRRFAFGLAGKARVQIAPGAALGLLQFLLQTLVFLEMTGGRKSHQVGMDLWLERTLKPSLGEGVGMMLSDRS